MLKNYLTITIRTFTRNALFTFINVVGLAIGLSSCLFVIYFVYDEITFDRFHEKAERIYRITTVFNSSNNIRFTDQKIGPYLKRVIPEVEDFVRFENYNAKFQKGNDWIQEDGIISTDSSVFNIFTYVLIAGNKQHVFDKGKQSIVLSQSLAKKYFGDDALGKTIYINKTPFEVTGIMKDVPKNSDKWVNGFVFGDFPGEELNDFRITFDTYVLLKPGVNKNQLKYRLEEAAINVWGNVDETPSYDIQPLVDLHFTYGIQMDNPKGNKNNIYIFLILAGILILVVIFNFVNLTIVRNLERKKEIGIRKVAGAKTSQISFQLLFESLLIIFISIIIALIICVVLHPFFHLVSGKVVSFNSIQNALVFIGVLLILFIMVLISSLYPAIYLSSLKPSQVLKGRYYNKMSSTSLRKFFIACQFFLGTSLLVFLMVVFLQTNKFKSADLGFNPNDVIVTSIPSQMKNKIQQLEGVLSVASVQFGSVPSEDPQNSSISFTQSGEKQNLQVQEIAGDNDYFELLKLQIIKGKSVKSFTESQWKNLVWINQTLAAKIGWEDPIGKELDVSVYDGEEGKRIVTIAGVIKDFHFNSLHNIIDPIIYLPRNGDNNLLVRIEPNQFAKFKNSWSKHLPDYEFGFLLVDKFEQQYKAEETLLTLLIIFSSLIAVLSAFGLYGLTIYIVKNRTKEIGIRKVIGASNYSIVYLISLEFIVPILVSTTIGFFISFIFSNNWLAKIAYKVDIDWWQWFMPINFVISFSLFFIAFKTYKIARANPTESLRHE